MKLLNYFFTERIGTSVVMILIALLLTIGLPTNIGGDWHLTTPWGSDTMWASIAAGVILVAAFCGLFYHVYQEFKKQN
jgi:hypothetical protein